MRYTIDEICQMPEGQTFDCKSVQTSPKTIANTIVAMANADGGMIAVGITDKARSIEGVDRHKENLNEILRAPFDFCVPTVTVSAEYLPCVNSDGKDDHILIMYIPASPLLHANQADEVYWRVGDKSHKLPFEERLRLMYDKGERNYEDSPAYDATIDDIDMDSVKAYIKLIGYGKTPMEFLAENKGFITTKNGAPQLSTACILLFGKRPQNFYPRARVRFIRYYGTEEKVGREMNVVKDVTFEGRILDQVRKTVEYLETQVKEHSYLGENGTFVTDREYPKFVIQEMVVNSVCHRDYSIKGTEIQVKMFDDRLVFETPGKLPGIVRTDNIRHTHFSRNPKIAEYLKAYDYVKEFGEGVDRMCRELSATGVREPEYRLVAFIMKATVTANILADEQEKTTQTAQNTTPTTQNTTPTTTPTAQNTTPTTTPTAQNTTPTIAKQKISPVQMEILALIKDNAQISRSEIAEKLGNITIGGVKYHLNILRQKGLLRRVGATFGGRWELIGNLNFIRDEKK